jgi:glutathione synthase/RimK-type ligase-like ATP-grasp enzyme
MRIALVTARAARGLDEDEPPLRLALQGAGCEVFSCEWDDPEVDWPSFDITLLRSAWDYAERRDEFIAWVSRIDSVTHLLNPVPIVRWNTDKHYLGELAGRGIATVPTTYVEPGQPAAQRLSTWLQQHAHSELVVKPAVGAGARDAQRHPRTDTAAIVGHIERLQSAGRSVMLQPYLQSVEHEGETALILFEGVFSHAICKGALLPAGAGPTAGLFATETISSRVPDPAQLQLATSALAALPFPPPLYARVDAVRDEAGIPCVLELELTEPSLYFTYAAGSADRFAAILLRWHAQHGPLPARGALS